MPINLSGSLVLTGSITATGGITISGSIASASYAVNASYLNNSGSGEFVPTGSFNTFSSSILTYTGSANSRFSSLETTSGSNITRISALEVTSGSNISRLSSLESKTGSYATTGSNTFVAVQYISQSSNPTGFTTTASLYTDGGLRVTKDAYVSGTLYLNNVTVYGTQSVAYITSSQLNIASNLITVNTATPSVQFGGLAVYDSGSSGLTGSILWDSTNNRWVYSNPSGSSYDGGMLISGPRNSSGLGNEVGTTACMLLAGQGGDHLTSSAIYHSTTATCIPNTLVGSTICTTMANASCIGIGTTNPVTTLQINAASPAIRLQETTSGGDKRLEFCVNTSGVAVIAANQSAQVLTIQTVGSERLKIDANGISCFACQVCAPQSNFTYTGNTGNVVRINGDNLTTGTALSIVLNNGAPTHTGNVVEICNAFNAGATAKLMCLYQGDDGDGIYINMARGGVGLTVDGVGSGYSAIFNNGNVGIGTTSPYQNLQVYQTGGAGNNYVEGTIQVGGTSTILGAALSYASQNSGYVNLVNLNTSGGANARISLGFGAISSGLPASTVMTLNQSGYVGIGNCTPDVKLVIGEDSSSSNVGYIRLRGHDVYEGNIYKTATYGIYMDTDSNAKPVRIDGSCLIAGIYGTVILGDTTPVPSTSYRLDVAGGYINVRPGYGLISRSATTECWGLGDTDFNFIRNGCLGLGTFTSKHMMFATNNTIRQMIASTGETCFACQVCAPSSIIKGTINEQLVLDFVAGAGSYTHQSFRLCGTNQYRLIGNTNGNFVLRNDIISSDVLTFACAGAATFACKIGIAGASATYPLTVYNGSNGTTAAFGGTTYGVRIDNDGTFSCGRSTIYGVDASFYGTYQPLAIGASALYFNISGTDKLTINSSGIACFANKITVNGVIESLTDAAGEGGQVMLRGTTYQYGLDNYGGCSFRVFREDDGTGASGIALMSVSKCGNIGFRTNQSIGANDNGGTIANNSFTTFNINGAGGDNSIGFIAFGAHRSGTTCGAVRMWAQYHTQGANGYSHILGRDEGGIFISNTGSGVECIINCSGGTVNFSIRYINLISTSSILGI